ncbi:MAG: L-threonylcarbamoyladenylate synthase [Thermodesulfovibrionales bacterium]
MERLILSEKNREFILNRAIEALEKGGIVAYPTETFYGLGVKFDIEDSLKRLYEIKKRQKYKAIPLIVGDKGLLPLITEFIDTRAFLLMEKFWPGPLTLILLAKRDISYYITAGTGKVAVRIPGESFALDLAKKANFPITATSANLSGFPPARDADTVINYLGNFIDLIIDGGHTPGGLPSTIVDVTGERIKIVREGAINKELIKANT